MGIRFQCPACGASLNIKSELAGKRGACPKCQAKIQIPPADAAAAAAVKGAVAATAASQATPDPAPAPAIAPTAAKTPSQSEELKWFVRPPSGGQYGPAGESVLRQWINEGRITPDTKVWHEGLSEWRPAMEAIPQLLALGPVGALAGNAQITPKAPARETPGLPLPSLSDTTPTADPASAAAEMLVARRKRARATGMLIMGILIVAILVLLPILIYVLMNPPRAAPPTETRAAVQSSGLAMVAVFHERA